MEEEAKEQEPLSDLEDEENFREEGEEEESEEEDEEEEDEAAQEKLVASMLRTEREEAAKIAESNLHRRVAERLMANEKSARSPLLKSESGTQSCSRGTLPLPQVNLKIADNRAKIPVLAIPCLGP